MLCARTFPSRTACCAVGGQNSPVVKSGTSAQSPTAHTPGRDPTLRNSFTFNRPRSLMQSRRSMVGLGEAPAVQTSVKLVNRVPSRSEEHTSELQSHLNLVCRLLLEK